MENEKKRKRDSKERLEQRLQASVGNKRDAFKKTFKILGLLFTLIVTFAFPVLYFTSDFFPKIRIDEIRPIGLDPFKHEFVITNDGRWNAKHFTARVKIELNDVYSTKISSNEMEKFLPTDGIEISNNQKIPFTLEKAIYSSGGWKVKDAVVKFFFNYTTCIGYPTYIDSICYRTFPAEDRLVWRPVGPGFQKLDKR